MTRWTVKDLERAVEWSAAHPTAVRKRPQSDSMEGQATQGSPELDKALKSLKKMLRPQEEVFNQIQSRPKYGNRKTGRYHSRKEANRALELQLLQASGKIRNLREQVKYVIFPKQMGERECYYLADFVYEEQDKDDFDIWKTVAEDCKGFKTPSYVIKRKGMLWRYGIRIRET